jgi:hypothetical protein
MVSIHSQQPRQGYLTKLTCWALFTLTTGIFARATAQKLLNKQSIYSKLATKDFLSGLLTTKTNKKLEAALLASLLGQTNKSVAKRSTTDDNDAIVKGTEILYQQMDQALTKIHKATQKTRELAEQIARSPWAIKTIKYLDAAIAMFTPTRPIVDYEISGYATRNKRWWRAPFQHPVSIQDLLLQDIKTRQEKNKLLGEKIERIMLQNQVLVQQASIICDTPSEKIKKSPIMNILTKTVATYMFL